MLKRLVLASLLLAAQPASQLPAASTGAGFAHASPRIDVRDVASGVRQVHVDGRWVLFVHDEAGADQNGDGDGTDRVYAVHDLVSKATSELGLAGERVSALSGGRAVVSVDESKQGASDLNGDGDTNDAVFFGVELATGTSVSSGLAGTNGGARFVGERVVLPVPETGQLADLDGNGTLAGHVCCVWESFGQVPEPIPLATTLPLVAHESYLLFSAFEQYAGNLNGDGDALDTVLHAVDLDDPSHAPVNTGLAVQSDRIRAAGPRSAFPVEEGWQSADLNGDGDLQDSVLHFFDVGVPLLSNTGLAIRASFVPTGHGTGVEGPALILDEQALVFAVSEVRQGADLNGDGRLVGSVLHVRDFAQGTTTSLGLSVHEFALGDGFVAFDTREVDQDADLDGNGVIEGHVAHVYELATSVTTNLGIRTAESFPAPAAFSFRGAFLALPGLEDGVDQNGDGDGSDSVLQILHLPTLALESQQVAVVLPLETTSTGRPYFTFSSDGWLSLPVSELADGRDLNGDGDLYDSPAQFLKPLTGARAASRIDVFQGNPLPKGFARRHPVLGDDLVLRVVRLRE